MDTSTRPPYSGISDPEVLGSMITRHGRSPEVGLLRPRLLTSDGPHTEEPSVIP